MQGDSPQGCGAGNLHQSKTQTETEMKKFSCATSEVLKPRLVKTLEDKN